MSTPLTSVTGDTLRERGRGTFNIQLGSLKLVQQIIVANIEDDCLLGLDVLMKSDLGPADIKLKENKVLLNGINIPCTKISTDKVVRTVHAIDDVIIPAQSERIVDVIIDFPENDVSDETLDISSHDYIIEPSPQFQQNYNLDMASTLVNDRDREFVPVRILNTQKTDVTIKQHDIIGEAEICEGDRIVKVLDAENESEDHNFFAIRRLQFQPGQGHDLHTTDPCTYITGEGQAIRQINTQKEVAVPIHVNELYEKATHGKSIDEKRALAEMLNKYEHVFSKNDEDLGLTKLVEHTINTGDSRPLRQPPRRVPLAFAEKEKEVVDLMQKQGIIQKSTSPWASPIVLVKKKNGKIRPCVDYRRLNAVTTQDAFPLPTVQDCLLAVRGSIYFSTFDITSGYHQVPVKQDDIPKTAFITKYGLFEFKTMPMGLCTASATFQRLMELVLQGLNWQTCIIYLDDIVVYGRSFEEHLQRVEEVLQRISESGLKLKPEKCQLMQQRVTFLGHVVTPDGVLPCPDNVAKILQWQQPTTVTEVRQFLGMASYYRKFIQGYAKLASPLVRLTKKDEPFNWTSECEESFTVLKNKLAGPEIMAYPRDDAEYILDTDASDIAIGAVLSQIQDGREKVISYGSRALNKAEKNYCITDKELLALRHFVEYYRQYLMGQKFLVRTDHQALVWLFKLKEPKARIARWLEILSVYNFEVQHRPGQKHGNCDSLSRCVNPRDCTCPDVDNSENLKCGPCNKCKKRMFDMKYSSEPHSVEVDTSQDMQIKDIQVEPGNPVRAVKTRGQQKFPSDFKFELWGAGSGNRPAHSDIILLSPAVRHCWHIFGSLDIHQGVLMKRAYDKNIQSCFWQLVTPERLRKDVMSSSHDNLLGGHLGRKKTQYKINRNFYWYNMKEDTSVYVASCLQCQMNKTPPRNPKAQLGNMKVSAPLDRLSTDILGPLPTTIRGNKYILTVTDHFTNWVEVMPIADQTAVTVARAIYNAVISRLGCPATIHSDQGRNYESSIFHELCKLLQIKKTRSSPRHPQGNGKSERFNRCILSMIKCYILDDKAEWDLHLQCIAAAYRSSMHESTGMTPNLMMLGREVCLPVDIIFKTSAPSDHQPVNHGEYVGKLREKLQRAHSIARQKTKTSIERQRHYYNINKKQMSYKVGEKVLYLHESPGKLDAVYKGPCTISKKLSDLTYGIKMREDVDIPCRRQKTTYLYKVVHHDKLKPYHPRE